LIEKIKMISFFKYQNDNILDQLESIWINLKIFYPSYEVFNNHVEKKY
jgi:hypothetical protein